VSGRDLASVVLVNASPDILAQLQATPALQPARDMRDTAIKAIVLVDGQVDHTTGLLMLRESIRAWPLWCTDSVYADLTVGNPLLKVLGHYCGVERRRIGVDEEWFAVGADDGLRWRATPLQSKPAPYSPNRNAPVAGDNIALSIQDARSGRTLFYGPGLGVMNERTWSAMCEADCVLIDGTFWTEDEMIQLGLSRKPAQAMGHLPQSGPGGMLSWLERLPNTTRKILIHINNTNPILDEDSPQRAELDARHIEVAYDGMEILL
jgi:pyrroloquinoline quinone biosynthesis protein B